MRGNPFLTAEDRAKLKAHRDRQEAIEIAKQAVAERNEAFSGEDREPILAYVRKWGSEEEAAHLAEMDDHAFLCHVHIVRLNIQTYSKEFRRQSAEWLLRNLMDPMKIALIREVL